MTGAIAIGVGVMVAICAALDPHVERLRRGHLERRRRRLAEALRINPERYADELLEMAPAAPYTLLLRFGVEIERPRPGSNAPWRLTTTSRDLEQLRAPLVAHLRTRIDHPTQETHTTQRTAS